jgi:hypothetical protein
MLEIIPSPFGRREGLVDGTVDGDLVGEGRGGEGEGRQ